MGKLDQGNGSKQADHLPGNQLITILMESMEEKDEFLVETEELQKTLCYGEKVAEDSK